MRDKVRQDYTRYDKTSQYNTIQDIVRQDKTGHAKVRQDNAI